MTKASPERSEVPGWLRALRVYLGVLGAGDLTWEAAHLPLYTLWKSGTAGEKLFAIVHCTGGDLLIGLTSLVLALVSVGHPAWPLQAYRPVAAMTLIFGVS